MLAVTGAVLLAAAGLAQAAGIDLGGSWQVTAENGKDPIPATVPGCIHTDLLAAKKIPDPFFRDNEKAVQWVSETNWIYRRSFTVGPDLLAREHVLLRCEGLDTLATIRLNGREIAQTKNMFRTYEFDVKSVLKPGANAIEIRFDSVLPVVQAKEKERKLPTWAYPGAAYVRKEPCNFGWDWGPTLITCGIWRPIKIVAFDTARIDDVRILQDHSQKGQVKLTVEVAAGPGKQAGLNAKITVSPDPIYRLHAAGFDGMTPTLDVATSDVNGGSAKADIVLKDPKLWWPAGMGEHQLYTVKTELLDAMGKVLDTSEKRIGLRTLRAIEATKDAPMHFVVNGVPFFAKGANWIPTDCFANRVTPNILNRYVRDAVAANMNCMRLWGGGYYEEDALYDACDEAGICLWVDFKFGCTTYPSFDPAFIDEVKHETADNLRRLRHHPSIAVWCGNNEIMFFRGGDKWTADKMSEGDYYKLFRDTLGGLVQELAPQSDYVTGSPDCGDVHFWDVWHGGKPFEVYRNIHGFVSEFGFQSFPEPKTTKTFTEPADRESVYSHVMKYHERSNRMYMDVKEDGKIGTDKIMILVRKYFREPKDFDSTLWLSQITQGYGIKYGAEGWRREMPRSMGCVYWQYNDTWPGSSWSSVDYFGRWKALHYMAKRFYEPVLVSGAEDVKAGKVDLWVTSDSMKDCRGKLTWAVTTVAGEKIRVGALDVDIPARKSRKVETLSLKDEIAKHGAKDLLVWMKLDVDGRTVSDNLVTLAYPKELNLIDPKVSAYVTKKEVTKGEPEFDVRLTAANPALWAWIELDGVDAKCTDNFVHIAPDRAVDIEVQPAKELTREEFQKALRIRSLYDTYAH
jgi:beta-mannosidase